MDDGPPLVADCRPAEAAEPSEGALDGLIVLTRCSVPTPTGPRLWSPATLHGILTNPACVGQAVAQRYRTRTPSQPHSPLRPIGRTRERHSSPSRPREEWIIVPVPAVVPEAQFAAAQRRLVRNRAGRVPGLGLLPA
ncbi:MAG TPA: recombinase family protein [Chloroflexota bacterium]|nr:recombinase family protein [Chloroflexota bacterium]